MKLFVFLHFVFAARASYVPGLVPKDFVIGQDLQIMTSTIESKHVHVRYDFYSTIGICPPENYKTHQVTFGEALAKELWIESPYKIQMGIDQKCTVICSHEITNDDIQRYFKLSDLDFQYKLKLDDLPSATQRHEVDATNQEETLYY